MEWPVSWPANVNAERTYGLSGPLGECEVELRDIASIHSSYILHVDGDNPSGHVQTVIRNHT